MKRIILASITAVVVVAVMAGTLIPILDDATATQETFKNESYYTLEKVTNDTDATIIWEVSDPNTISVNGNEVSLAGLPTGRSYTLVGSESVMIRYTVSAGVTYIETLAEDYLNDNSSSPLTTITISINGSTLTYLDDRATPTSKTYTLVGDAYYISPDDSGEYAEVMKDANEPAYVKGDSDIHLIGSTIGSATIGVYGNGNIDDGISLNTVYKSAGVTTDVTFTDPVATATPVSGYEGLYLLEKYTFTMSYNTTESIDATYTYFIVPAEVTAERSVHFSDGENAILNAIPAMIIIALLLGVVALVLRSRMD